MSDTSTRSGLLWEVERILTECKELGQLPQCLIMENVIQVASADNVADFNKWQLKLEELGYKNYCQNLIATDYGIPQTRNRTFMVSILGEYSYTFPKPIPLKIKLKDLLNEEVDDKYYLSTKTLEQISNWKSFQNPLDGVLGKESVCPTITTRIAESQDGGINASMKVYCSELENTTNLRNELKPKVIGGVGEKDSNNGQQWKQQNRIYEGDVAIAVTTSFNPYYKNDLKIRKLTPRECGRLMCVSEKDIDKILVNQSDTSAYHLFGDAIVSSVMMALYGELLQIDWKNKITQLLDELKRGGN